MKITLFALLLLAVVGLFSESQAQTQITVTAVNRLNMARESETIELNAQALASRGEKDLMMKPGINTPVTYWAGFAWDRAGHIPSGPAWKRYLDDFRERLGSPIAVTVK